MVNYVSKLYYRLIIDTNWSNPAPKNAPTNFFDGKQSLRGQFYRSTTYQEAHETIIYCMFNSIECSFFNFSIYKDEKYFACLTFEPNQRMLVQEGEDNGLFLLLYRKGSSFNSYRDEIESPAAFKVALHEPGFKPDLSTALTAPMRYKTQLEFSVIKENTINRKLSLCVTSLPNVTYVSDYSRPGEFENVTHFATDKDCLTRLKQMEFLRECGCLAEHLALPADLMELWPVCHSLPYDAVYRDVTAVAISPGRDAYVYKILNDSGQPEPLQLFLSNRATKFDIAAFRAQCFNRIVRRQGQHGIIGADSCLKLCHRTEFPSSRTSDAWPPSLIGVDKLQASVRGALVKLAQKANDAGLNDIEIQSDLKALSNDIKDYYAILKIFSMSTKTTVSDEEFSYMLKDFFSDLGGILGLWVGVSVITLMELIELVTQLVTFCATRTANLKPTRLGDESFKSECRIGADRVDAATVGYEKTTELVIVDA